MWLACTEKFQNRFLDWRHLNIQIGKILTNYICGLIRSYIRRLSVKFSFWNFSYIPFVLIAVKFSVAWTKDVSSNGVGRLSFPVLSLLSISINSHPVSKLNS